MTPGRSIHAHSPDPKSDLSTIYHPYTHLESVDHQIHRSLQFFLQAHQTIYRVVKLAILIHTMGKNAHPAYHLYSGYLCYILEIELYNEYLLYFH